MSNVTYERVNWEDSPSENTPVNGTNLNKMDKGISDCAAEINNLNETVANLSHVGQIIMSTTLSTEASVIAVYGGSQWVKIEGKFLLGASSSHAVNSTGGSENVVLTESQLPKIKGGFYARGVYNEGQNIIGDGPGIFTVAVKQGISWLNSVVTQSQTKNTDLVTMEFGNNQPHDNMPPYKAVYIWERTA